MEILLGAVAYDAKVVTIWDGFRAYCGARGVALDYILYTSYERQVAAHLRGDIHVAWNSPLAWLQIERAAREAGRAARTIAMRDSDRDLTSVILVRADGARDVDRGICAAAASASAPATRRRRR